MHFKLSSNQPNAKFHVYKLPKNNPKASDCQDPEGIKDYTDVVTADNDPRDFEVDNDTRIVVLGSNLEYVNPADLKLEMSLPAPQIYVAGRIYMGALASPFCFENHDPCIPRGQGSIDNIGGSDLEIISISGGVGANPKSFTIPPHSYIWFDVVASECGAENNVTTFTTLTITYKDGDSVGKQIVPVEIFCGFGG